MADPTSVAAPAPAQEPMLLKTNIVGFNTIVIREFSRIIRIWGQTIVPPAITATLYFVIFGSLIGSRIGDMGGYSYIQYIAPGLIMMSVITNSYGNVVSSFFGAKFGKGDTSSSSMCLPNLAPKNEDTTLPYDVVITAIMIRPGAM